MKRIIRSRFRPAALCADAQKAFLQIAIKEEIKMCFDFISLRKEIYKVHKVTTRKVSFRTYSVTMHIHCNSRLSPRKTEISESKTIRKVAQRWNVYLDDCITGGRKKDSENQNHNNVSIQNLSVQLTQMTKQRQRAWNNS